MGVRKPLITNEAAVACARVRRKIPKDEALPGKIHAVPEAML
jgi:hypothetical protein